MSTATYQTVNWALTGVAGVLSIGRYAIRGYSSRRFHWDDAAHLVALLLLVTHSATNQVTAAAKTQLTTDRTAYVSDDALLSEYRHVYQLNTANNVLLYLVFWSVKLTFLMLYRVLFGSSKRFMRIWWIVLGVTVVTYFVPFGGVVATCYGVNTLDGFVQCNSATHARAVKLEYSCAFNVATDFSIMVLPLWMIHDLKIKARQKVALALIFSLALFCIALDILRTVMALASNQNLYTVLEVNMVVIISCLPTYSALFSIRERHRSRGSSYGHAYKPSSGYISSISKPSQSTSSKIPYSPPISINRSYHVESHLRTDLSANCIPSEKSNSKGATFWNASPDSTSFTRVSINEISAVHDDEGSDIFPIMQNNQSTHEISHAQHEVRR